jgi:hypothetical protein
MRDEELRSQLGDVMAAAAHRSIPEIGVLRRRIRRRVLRRSLVVATVVAGIAGIGLGVNASLQGPSRPPRSASPPVAASSPPRWTWYPDAWFPAEKLPAADAGPSGTPYLVQVSDDAAFGPASVINAFTGVQAGLIDQPAGVTYIGVAAAGDDHTFVLAGYTGSTVRFYEVRLGSRGQPHAPVLLLSVPAKSIQQIDDFAVSPDARMLAYATPTGLEVVSLATGKTMFWQASHGYAGDFSWAGDNRTLAFDWFPESTSQVEVRLLDVERPGSLVQASRLVIRTPGEDGFPLITADGSKIFAADYPEVTAQGNPAVGAVREYSASTGQPLATVTSRVHGSDQNMLLCQPLWTDASGRQVVSDCNVMAQLGGSTISIFLYDGHLVPNSMQIQIQGGTEGAVQIGNKTVGGELLAW